MLATRNHKSDGPIKLSFQVSLIPTIPLLSPGICIVSRDARQAQKLVEDGVALCHAGCRVF